MLLAKYDLFKMSGRTFAEIQGMYPVTQGLPYF